MATRFRFEIENIGAPGLSSRLAGEIDQHREQLGADVGVRLEPEAVGVEAIFDAQEAVAQLHLAQAFDAIDDAQALEAGAERVAYGIARAILGAEEQTRAVVGFALAERVVDAGRRDGNRVDALADVRGEHVFEKPMAIGLGAEAARVEAADQARGDGGRVNHGPLPPWRRGAA